MPEANINFDQNVGKIRITFNPGTTCWRTGKNCQDGTFQSFNACWGKLNILRDGYLIRTQQPTRQGEASGYLIDFFDDGADPYKPHIYSFKAIWDETYPGCSNCSHPPSTCQRDYHYSPPPPCVPNNLSCSTASCGSRNIALSWSVQNPSGNVILKRYQNESWVDVTTIPAQSNMSYTDQPAYGTYAYIVTCGNYGSDIVSCTTQPCPTPTPTPLPDTSPPNPPTVVATYDSAGHKINFSWSWQGDKTCPGCLGPVGFCQPNGISDQGFACDNALNPPFWWQVVRTDTNEAIAYSYNNQPNNQKVAGGNASNSNSFSYSCQGLEGKTLRLDVRTRDAKGNIIPISQPISVSATQQHGRARWHRYGIGHAFARSRDERTGGQGESGRFGA
ncbi:MAG: hypothetical protein NZP34_04955 [Caldilineales bacterium]|nr:hypothetical protein [Caldilineales bacterium]